jgi:hypothetical protein
VDRLGDRAGRLTIAGGVRRKKIFVARVDFPGARSTSGCHELLAPTEMKGDRNASLGRF